AGVTESSDSDVVAELAGLSRSRILPELYSLGTPCSPHRAAEIDGVRIRHFTPPMVSPLVVEGAGGALVPLTRSLLLADLMVQWCMPVILVAPTTLGTINHSLLSIEALRRRNI